MADEELRALERRWRTTGAVDDGAAFLQAKLRAGLIDEQRLRLAAFVGDPAAALVAGCEAAPRHLLTCDPFELGEYLVGVGAWGKEAGVRLGTASARAVQRLGPELGLDDEALDLVSTGISSAELRLLPWSRPNASAVMRGQRRLLHACTYYDGPEDLRFHAIECAHNAADAAAAWSQGKGEQEKAEHVAACAGWAAESAAMVLDLAKEASSAAPGRRAPLDRRPLLNGIWWELSWWAPGLGPGD